MSTTLQHEVDSDPLAFTAYARSKGWTDGLPVIPPTPERVEEYVLAADAPADAVIAAIPPLWGECTVERLAVNAVMAGAEAAAMPLLIASLRAMSDTDFDLLGANVTTAPVVPAVIVNGPQRHELEIPFAGGCLGGADGNSTAIGRALRLVMRNVGGQQIGSTSQSVHGQPGRVSGIVFGEWEERSPWKPLAERRGVPGNGITAFPAMGTMNILDRSSLTPPLLVKQLGRSIAYPGAASYTYNTHVREIVVGINPVWAELIGSEFTDIDELTRLIWEAAALPLSLWPKELHSLYESADRVDENGLVHATYSPEDLLILVSGWLGGLHGFALHGFGLSTAVTTAV